jgi:drug/metabolite transporter (DMT)-like permease
LPGSGARLAWLLLGELPGLNVISGLVLASLGCWLVNAVSEKR